MSARSPVVRACRFTWTSGAGNADFIHWNTAGEVLAGTAATFDLARVGFEAAWRAYLPLCTEIDFAEHRRQRAWTDWKYTMHDTGTPLPTQMAGGRSRCFCGAELDIQGVDLHIREAHMTDQQTA